jgi:soluble lytic murein transglycosylase-like protein
MIELRALVCCLLAAMALAQPARAADARFDALIAQQASANGVPVALVRRIIQRESGFNPRLIDHDNYGLMQIRLGTARALGYRGAPAGLLDPETNMIYAVRYLAGAYRAAHGNEMRAVAFYMRGY